MTDYRLYTEEKVFELIRKDDKKAFAELFDRYWRKAFNIAWSKLHDRLTAEEIVQELFIMLWDKRSTLNVRNFPSFLYACVKNKCLNHIESLLIQQKHWDYYKRFLNTADETTSKNVAYDELLEAVNAGIATLPQKTRRIFQLNRLEGKSVPEIASALQVSEKAIEYHLTRSLKQLKIRLKDFILMFAAVSLF